MIVAMIPIQPFCKESQLEGALTSLPGYQFHWLLVQNGQRARVCDDNQYYYYVPQVWFSKIG